MGRPRAPTPTPPPAPCALATMAVKGMRRPSRVLVVKHTNPWTASCALDAPLPPPPPPTGCWALRRASAIARLAAKASTRRSGADRGASCTTGAEGDPWAAKGDDGDATERGALAGQPVASCTPAVLLLSTSLPHTAIRSYPCTQPDSRAAALAHAPCAQTYVTSGSHAIPALCHPPRCPHVLATDGGSCR